MTNEPRAISRRFLNPDGTKDGKPLSLGPMAGAVCKLCPDEDVTIGLGLAEGVETALSIIAAGWRPVWACGGTATLANFPILAGIEALTIFADHDEGGAGIRAANKCARRYCSAGREVRIMIPKAAGEDFNDALRIVS